MLPRIEGNVSPCYENVNKLGWTDGFVIAPFGMKLGVRTNDSATLRRIRSALPACCPVVKDETCEVMLSLRAGGKARREGQRHFNLLYAGHTRIIRSLDLDSVIAEALQQIVFILAVTASTQAILGGTLVEFGGARVMLPGDAESDLARTLTASGVKGLFGGLFVMNHSGKVRPWQHGTVEDDNTWIDVDSWIFCTRTKRKRPRCVLLTAGEAAANLFSQTLSASAKPFEMLKLSAIVAPGMRAFRAELPLTIASADDVVRVLQQHNIDERAGVVA